jgi:hypothetical protein
MDSELPAAYPRGQQQSIDNPETSHATYEKLVGVLNTGISRSLAIGICESHERCFAVHSSHSVETLRRAGILRAWRKTPLYPLQSTISATLAFVRISHSGSPTSYLLPDNRIDSRLHRPRELAWVLSHSQYADRGVGEEVGEMAALGEAGCDCYPGRYVAEVVQ